MSDERESFSTGDAGADNNAAIEARAREVGWVPQDEFRGDVAKWKDAEAFLDYADHVTPVLKKNNEKLTESLRQRDIALGNMSAKLDEQSRILKALTDAAAEETVTKTENKLENLRARLVQANRDQDAELAATIQEELVDLKLELKTKPAAIDITKPETKQPAMTVEEKQNWDSWVSENEWYSDPVFAAAATSMGSIIISEAIASGKTPPKGRTLLDEVTKRMDNKFNLFKGKSEDKVTGGTSTSGSTGTSKAGKRFSSLPADAKAACDMQAKKFVGTGKRYAKLEDWQKRFTEIYYSDSEA